jgi:hypothetical protein
MYKFVTARFYFKNNLNFYNIKVLEKFNKNLPKNFLNVLFFQYWMTFFSSVLILFFLIQIINIFGSSEWSFLNFFNYLLINFSFLETTIFYTIFLIFIISFFLKIGMTPIHLFKIEVYKGIPFYTIYFYTIFYFFVYFLYFSLLAIILLQSFNIFIWFSLTILVIIGTLIFISYLFDVTLVKSFFAYSTIINTLLFICLLLNILI